MSGSVIVSTARTPIGKLSGALAGFSAMDLGGIAIKAALERGGVGPEQVDYVVMGQVLQAGQGQITARQAALKAGIPMTTPALTINKVCGSGLKAVMLAAQAIQCGDAQVVVAGGTENMSRAPYLLEKARGGYRMGNGEIVDCMIRDGLWDVYNNMHMGMCGDRCAEKYGFSREQQDEFAVASFKRAIEAASSGAFAEEITPVEVKAGKETVTVSEDENLKKFNEEKLRKLRPAFGEKGTVTAGNASSINDGAAAVLVLSGDKVKELGVTPQARILGYATFAREPEWFTLAPIGAIALLLKRLSLQVGDVGLFEINEAFSVVPMAAMKDLGIPHDKCNVHGGAVALGHPIGASGTLTLVTLLNAMRRLGVRTGVDSLCIGGGESVALAVELC
jgi:acetyl-CoA C-acetyltransferase